MGARELLLVRHGQSTANANALTPGAGEPTERDPDVPLTRLGIAQSKAVGRWLRTQPDDRFPDSVWCSPYLRATETARLALAGQRLRLPIRIDERLRDREAGTPHVLTAAEGPAPLPGEAAHRARLGKFYYRPPGGESWADVALRLRTFLTDLQSLPGERVLVVSHDTPIVLFRYICERASEAAILALERTDPLRNASISRFVRGADGWRIADYNRVAHLEPRAVDQ